MKISTSAARGAVTALLLTGTAFAAFVPAIGQDSPESLLPPGFDEPAAPAPAPAPGPSRPPTTVAEPTTSAPAAPLSAPIGNDTAAEEGDAPLLTPEELAKYELPDFAKRSLDRIGAVALGNPVFPENAFGSGDGRFLSVLMQRLNAPVPSRWASIALRRALLSPVDTPANVNGADFAAERAWLLVRMGEPVAARAVAQGVDTENYTPRMFDVAMQVALASGDPAAMCPLVEPAVRVSTSRGWSLAQAMCAGLEGRPDKADELFRAARRGTSGNDIDNLLAEKVMGSGAQGRRAVTIEWQTVDRLSAWRYGLAAASGEQIPLELFGSVGPQVRYWQALSPMAELSARAISAELAAAQGVFSSAALVDLYGEVGDQDDAGGAEMGVARDLRAAFADADVADRVSAMRTLWDEPTSPRQRYARLVMTARAAAAVPPNADRAQDADRLIASMLSAGYDQRAMAWRGIVPRESDGWAMIALADPAPGARVNRGDFDAYRGAASARKAQLLLAGLVGLGRLGDGEAEQAAASVDVAVGAANAWTRAIDAAAQRSDGGTVALLAAVGMQSRTWADVTPEALFHIVAGFRVAGMPNYARMIAVEAIARS